MAIRLLRDLTGESLVEVSVYLDTRNAKPSKLHELIDGDAAPFVEGQARDIPEGDMGCRIVLGDIPSAGSGDIEEFSDEARIFFAVLRQEVIALGEAFEIFEKSSLLHR